MNRLAFAILSPMGLSLAEYKILYICLQNPEKRITNAFLEQHFQMSHSTDALFQAGQDLEKRFTANLTKEEIEEYIRLSKKILA